MQFRNQIQNLNKYHQEEIKFSSEFSISREIHMPSHHLQNGKPWLIKKLVEKFRKRETRRIPIAVGNVVWWKPCVTLQSVEWL